MYLATARDGSDTEVKADVGAQRHGFSASSSVMCMWPTVERDSACGWAIRIYEKLKTNLEAKKLYTWDYSYTALIYCTHCEVERGCCKKTKLTLAMTSQILDWLKQHQEDLSSILYTGEQRILVYCRDL